MANQLKTVPVISGRTNTVVATVGLLPTGVATNPRTHTTYVTSFQDNALSVLGS